jgi:Na+-driven multidrug efflux pump
MPQRNPYLVHQTFKSYLFANILTSMALSLGVMISSIIVGNLLGPNALSAINLSQPFVQLLSALTVLINMGGAMLMAMAIGKQKYEEANRIFLLSMSLNIVVSILLVALGIFFLDEVVRLLCNDVALQPLVKEYVYVMILSSPAYLILMGLCMYIRTDSNPNLVSWSVIIANIVNIALAILFIKVFSWGIKSASLATVIGFIVGIGVISTHFLKKDRLLHFAAGIVFCAGVKQGAGGFCKVGAGSGRRYCRRRWLRLDRHHSYGGNN